MLQEIDNTFSISLLALDCHKHNQDPNTLATEISQLLMSKKAWNIYYNVYSGGTSWQQNQLPEK